MIFVLVVTQGCQVSSHNSVDALGAALAGLSIDIPNSEFAGCLSWARSAIPGRWLDGPDFMVFCVDGIHPELLL